MNLKNASIAIIGLGYVGLPLAIEFAKHFHTVGFDISGKRINDLKNSIDYTKETTSEQIESVLKKELSPKEKGLFITQNLEETSHCNIYIITVPTPIDDSKRPYLTPLIIATEMIGKILKKGDIVIYESTTYPGCTEEVCVPVLEEISGLKYNQDFFVGYSPERINPGDKVNTLVKIKKVTSGSNPEIADFINDLYGTIITAGTFKASSIKVAEASKAIENAQRDINISFMNELAIIFEKLGIDTGDVLEAAATKWNFLKYKPGLVGGHCIGVDPYYLAYKAEKVGYIPNVILSGRRVNDQMGSFIANKVVKMMINEGIEIKNSRILILGITFKENCPDFRNTKIIDIHKELREFGCDVTILDSWADKNEVKNKLGVEIKNDFPEIDNEKFDAVILAVSHNEFKNLDLNQVKAEKSIVYDCKGLFDRNLVNARL